MGSTRRSIVAEYKAIRLDPYAYTYYCSNCGLYIWKESAVLDSLNRPRCPFCLRMLRSKPRTKRKLKVKFYGSIKSTHRIS